MEKTKQNKFILFLLLFLVVVAVGLTGFLYYMFSSESGQCLANPMNYMEKKIEEQNEGARVLCECKNTMTGFSGLEGVEIEWKEE